MEKFSIAKRIKSFKFAIAGISTLFKEEHNSRVHLLATLIVIIAALYHDISSSEWLALAFAIALVFITEIFNTAIENICNFISPQKDPRIKRIKDLSAAAVLLSAICSIVIGILIFLPRII